MNSTDPVPTGAPLGGQTVVVIGGSSGIGLATAAQARAAGADVIITGRDRGRLDRAARQVGAARTSSFDATDPAELQRFFDSLPDPVDHLLLTGSGPYYATLREFDVERGQEDAATHLFLPIRLGQHAFTAIRPGGTLLFIGGTGGRRPAPGLVLLSALTVAMPALVRVLALELAPIRANLIACGFVDTPLSATLLGDQLDERRRELRETLPIGRVVGSDDVAAVAIHLMLDSAITGATIDVDGGQQLV
jgi:NAD(P)-dependent dehydrogenase (short-subunit alcohol dehydrogenase family)